MEVKEESTSPCRSISSPGSDDSAEDMQMSDKEPSATTPTEVRGSRRSCEKYNLRKSSVRVRVQTEQKKQQPKQRKAKSRPPPLSKYRRRTANARERSRMAEINDAFQELKQALPQDSLDGKLDDCANSSPSSSRSKSSKSKTSQPTKATVLRLAIDYIAALRDILGYSSSSSSSEGSSSESTSGGSSGDMGDPLSDDIGSDGAFSTTHTPSTSSASGDEESVMSSDLDTGGVMSEM